MKTPLLVPIPETFDEYLASASKRCRHEYRRSQKHGLTYREIPFDRDLVAHWMAVWERQVVKGKHPKWRKYTPERCQRLSEDGILRVFTVGIGLHMAEVCGDYVYSHPPLYDKSNPIAKVMWFGLIEWCCGKVRWLDLGGGSQKAWNEIPRQGYKWLYVPKDIERKPLKVQVCGCGWRQLVVKPAACRRCAS